MEDYTQTKLDVWVGTIFAILIVFFIVVSTAATLHKAGFRSPRGRRRAALARSPDATRKHFLDSVCSGVDAGGRCVAAGDGLLDQRGAGFEKGVSRSFREAPIFLGTFTFLVAVGALIAVFQTCR
jgi:hypothetical protein